MVNIFNIDLNKTQRHILNQIHIERSIDPFVNFVHDQTNQWMSFNGNLDEVIFKGIKDTSFKNSDDLCYKASKIIAKLINTLQHKLKKDMKLENYNKIFWLRFETPDPEFNIPRWHTDGNYLSHNEKKILISLKGKGTLLAKCKDNQKLIKDIRLYKKLYPSFILYVNNIEVINRANYIKYNTIITELLKKNCEILQLNNFQGVIYDVGNSDNACIHSEPNKDTPRILLGILISEK